jgi:hypothetical protein
LPSGLYTFSFSTLLNSHAPCRVKAGQGADAEALGEFTPSFLWLLRDFYLKLEEDGRQVSRRGGWGRWETQRGLHFRLWS